MPKSKRSSASSTVMPMVGRSAGREVKQPIGKVPGVTGSKVKRGGKGKRVKSIKTNQGTSGIIREPRG